MNPPSSHTKRSSAASSKRPRWFCYLGFVALAGTLLMLYGASTYQAWLLHPASGFLVTLLLGMVALALWREVRALAHQPACILFSRASGFNFAGVVGGALLTYLLGNTLELGAVTASGLIGLLGALLFPQQAVAIYCGSFVGMSSVLLLANVFEVVLGGGLAGLLYILTTPCLKGFGGKLGTIAFTAVTVHTLGMGRHFTTGALPSPILMGQIVFWATLAALLTYVLSVKLHHGPVIGSSVVGLVGGLVLPALLPQHGALLAVVVICASFTGMSNAKRIPNYIWMTVAGLITGLVFSFSLPMLGGGGGKLGTIALGASLATWGLRTLRD